jgi:hypothetical protein
VGSDKKGKPHLFGRAGGTTIDIWSHARRTDTQLHSCSKFESGSHNVPVNVNRPDTKLETREDWEKVSTAGTGVYSRSWCLQQELVSTAGTGVYSRSWCLQQELVSTAACHRNLSSFRSICSILSIPAYITVYLKS